MFPKNGCDDLRSYLGRKYRHFNRKKSALSFFGNVIMDDVIKTASRLLILICCLILLYLFVAFVAGVVQLAEAADRIHQGLGQPVFVSLILLFLILLGSPFYIYFRLPKALILPNENSGPEYDSYLLQLRIRLARNPLLEGKPINTEDDVKQVLKILSNEVDTIIRKTAGNVFVGTAISQNGKLDGLISFATQVKMVWEIACIYHQRPAPRQMLYLYSNVATNALLADSLDDIDFDQIMAPLFSSLGFGVAAAIPGTSVIINSITNGSSNAFLTLRVGCIAKQYCEAISKPDKSVVRRKATVAAASLVVSIIKERGEPILSSAKNIVSTKAIEAVRNTTEKVKSSVSSGVNSVGSAMGSVVDSATDTTRKVSDVLTTKAEVVGNLLSSTVDEVKVITETALGTVAQDTKAATKKATDAVLNGARSVGNAIRSTILEK